MSPSKRLCWLAVTSALFINSGCTAPRHIAGTGEANREANFVTCPPISRENGISDQVKPVAYLDEQLGELLNRSSHEELQPVTTAETETTSTDSGMTLEVLEQLALANNPAILQATSQIARVRGFHQQVGLKPNPTIGYFGEEIGNEGAGGLHGGFVSQTLVRGGKLERNRQVLNHDVKVMLWELETQQQRILTDVRIAFFKAITAQQRYRLAKEFRIVAEQAVAVAEEQFEAKIGTLPDVLQSEIQLNEVELSVREAKFDQVAARRELAALTGVAEFGSESLAGSFEEVFESRDEESIFAEIVSASPLIVAAQTRVDRARANLQRQKIQAIPNLTTQFGAGGDDATGDAFANLQVSLPLPFHNKNQGNVRAAHAEYCAAVQNVEQIRARIRRDLARTMREYNIANAIVQRYETAILPKASQTMELMSEGRKAGEFEFLRVLTARRAYFDARLNYVDALGKRSQATAKLNGLLLTDGLSYASEPKVGDELRGQALSGR